ncbi:protein NRT1/ PTR FAMILY 8.3-like [Quillaja saponaria]|uniref:Protein NRT1/ PTR FAMILY 8.3-like n=1 Tax=Quillaja saponaria TaxID=32244 RepID=A0AAD7P5F4_QUISA|nr:protein NRT1/ PTR FAMILY 8.3-like [Quillaja saponaria]
MIADASLGRYWTIAAFSAINFIGMCILTLSASVPALTPTKCVASSCPSATAAQSAVFFFGLYLVALGVGGINPCISSFGANQFDDTDPMERVQKGFFFNWFYFSVNIGALISSSLIVWIQDNVGWSLGFGVPSLLMGVAIVSFFSGSPLYRFQKPGGSPITRICQVLVASFRKWNLMVPTDSSLLYETQDEYSVIEGSRKLEHSEELKWLDKAAMMSENDMTTRDLFNPWKICTITQVEELKILIHIIPPASLSMLDAGNVIFWVPVYDRIIVPFARKYTGKERGFSELQRIAIGLFLSVLCMSAAAVVEMKRLQLARELGLVDQDVAVPLSILWQIPQYMLLGAADFFAYVGRLEFFYNQSPDAMRTLCSAVPLLTAGLGNYLSSLILTIVTYLTTKGGKAGWIANNLNEGHLDYFFWFLSGLSTINMLMFILCAKKYRQKKSS